MEFVFAIPLLFTPFMMPLITGLMAKNFGRKFWLWFFLGLLLPFIAAIVLLCLPDKSKRKVVELRPVENDEVFDYLFITKNQNQFANHESSFSATA